MWLLTTYRLLTSKWKRLVWRFDLWLLSIKTSWKCQKIAKIVWIVLYSQNFCNTFNFFLKKLKLSRRKVGSQIGERWQVIKSALGSPISTTGSLAIFDIDKDSCFYSVSFLLLIPVNVWKKMTSYSSYWTGRLCLKPTLSYLLVSTTENLIRFKFIEWQEERESEPPGKLSKTIQSWDAVPLKRDQTLEEL